MFPSGPLRKYLRLGLLLLLALLPSATAAVRVSEAEYRKAWQAAREAKYEEADRIAAEALRAAGKSEDEWVWALKMLRAEILVRRGKDLETARAILEKPLPPRYRKTEAEVRRLIALTRLTYQTKRVNEAKAIADEAVKVAKAHVPSVLADAYIARGAMRQDERDLREALRLANARKDEPTAVTASLSLVYFYGSKKRFVEAIEIGEKTIDRAMVLKQYENAFKTIGNLAWNYYALGDYETAKEMFARAEAECRSRGLQPERIVWLDRLGDVHLTLRDLPGAARWYAEAEQLARQTGHRQLPTILANRARVAIANGQLAEARPLIEEAIAREREFKDEDDVLRNRIIRASLNIAAGDRGKAEQELKEIVGAEQVAPELRWEAEARLARLYELEKKRDRADKYYRTAVETAQKARNEIEPDYRFSFFNGLTELYESYVDYLVDTKREELALALTEEIRAQTLEEGRDLTTSEPRSAKDAAKRAGATILCYWLGRNRSYVWTVTATDVILTRLKASAADIEREADAYQKDLRSTRGTLDQSRPRGERLYHWLIAPALPANTSRVVIIADGKLHAINFETLVVPGPPQPRWWIEDVTVASAPSLQLLTRAAVKKPNGGRLLLVGNPPMVNENFPKLEFADAEMQKVRKHFPKTTTELGGPNATPKKFLAADPSAFDILHFVAHGKATRKQPLDSAVILGRDGSNGDYRLFARDIVKKPLKARLVTISSCYGAGERTYAGEGLVGLAWAFLRAGADEVIAALWEVNDAATPELMDRMYAGIAAGKPPAVALRDAKLSLLRQVNSSRKHPKFWAPFVLYSGS